MEYKDVPLITLNLAILISVDGLLVMRLGRLSEFCSAERVMCCKSSGLISSVPTGLTMVAVTVAFAVTWAETDFTVSSSRIANKNLTIGQYFTR